MFAKKAPTLYSKSALSYSRYHMRFDIITIFPHIFDSYLQEALIKRACDKNLIRVNVHNLRDWTEDFRQTVDDRPFGGGPGMVLKVEPIYKAVQTLKSKPDSRESRVILLSVRGKRFTQKKAYEYSKLDQLILICGRYEGVDERIRKHIVDESISIGNYILSGGELASLVIMEAVARLIPGVVGKAASLKKDIARELGAQAVSFPQYTRPEVFKTEKGEIWRVPKVLLSGDHKKIEEWRKKRIKRLT